MRPVLKYPGAKNRLAPWISSYIPEHKVYLEPYAGSLAVLFHKQRCHIETVNDLNSDIVHFFHVLRDHGDELRKQILLTPYSREEYDLAFIPTDDPVERARRFCVRCWMGRNSANFAKTGFKNGQSKTASNPAKAWALLPDTMEAAIQRLQRVQIEHKPALDLIKMYQKEEVFIYADPPYLHETRTQKHLYQYEMTKTEHIELLEVLLEHPGKVLLSGYDNDLYNDMLSDWNKVQKGTVSEAGTKRIETLWANYSFEKILQKNK